MALKEPDLLHSNDSSDCGAVFGGIDWGGSFHQLCVIDGDGTVRLQRRVTHDVAGLAELDHILAAQTAALRVAIERAEGLLVEHLLALGVEVYCMSPKIAARARERYRLAASKSDTLDAFFLADTLRHEPGHWRPLSPLLAELRAVTRDRRRVLYAQQACESQLRAIIDAYHPAPLHLFSTLDRDISLDFIADYPTPEQAGRRGPPPCPPPEGITARPGPQVDSGSLCGAPAAYSMRYVSYGDRKTIAAALRPIYTAVNADAAEAALAEFRRVHGSRYPGIVATWERAWTEFTPFLAFARDIRKIIYTTNLIESINYQLRKITKTRVILAVRSGSTCP